MIIFAIYKDAMIGPVSYYKDAMIGPVSYIRMPLLAQ